MLGNKLRQLREERGLTQSELADQVGIVTSFISLMEHGERQPSIDTLAKLADVLGVGIDELMGRPALVPAVKTARNGSAFSEAIK